MKLINCLVSLFLLFNYINAESTCLSNDGWRGRFGSVADGEVCDLKYAEQGILACDITGNGKKLTCDGLSALVGAKFGYWKKAGSCTEDANGNWCT